MQEQCISFSLHGGITLSEAINENGEKVKVVLLFNVFYKKAHRLGILRMLMEKSLQHIILHNVYLSFCVVQFYYLKTNAENAIQKT